MGLWVWPVECVVEVTESSGCQETCYCLPVRLTCWQIVRDSFRAVEIQQSGGQGPSGDEM